MKGLRISMGLTQLWIACVDCEIVWGLHDGRDCGMIGVPVGRRARGKFRARALLFYGVASSTSYDLPNSVRALFFFRPSTAVDVEGRYVHTVGVRCHGLVTGGLVIGNEWRGPCAW